MLHIIKRQDKLMKLRIISGIFGAAFIIAALALNKIFPILINIIAAFASLLCVTELLTAKGLLKNFKLSLPPMLFAALFPVLISTSYWPIVLLLYVFATFIIMLKWHENINYSDVAFVLASTAVVVFGLSSIVMLCDNDRMHTGFYFTMALVIPWVADIGAYFIGSFFGRHKLCPKISPKKTVEGAAGGIIGGVLGALCDALVFQIFLFVSGEQIHYLSLIIVALIGSLISIVGDLSFSIIKRMCHVKDYGNVIPGHGGLLDRCDSVVFAAPLLLVFTQYFPIMTLA